MQQDFTKYAAAILMLIRHRGRLTSNQCVNFLLGRKANMEREGVEQYYGMAKHIGKHDMHRILDRLATGGALTENNVTHRTSRMAIQFFQLGPNARALLSGEQSFAMVTKTRSDSQAALSAIEELAGKPIPTY
ncbi:hypothetical protein F4677DRAFT_363193 [Hypoxylon crocopeplum]|nr:hypothetical protein F4677DRAFT_363193 [Hypoxylon crocopeplum]